MDEAQGVIRESRGRRYLGFLIFLLIGTVALIFQGAVQEICGVRVEWFFLVIIYIGIYKPPLMSILLAAMLGLLLDLYSGTIFGEGLFCSFFVMGSSRLISRIIYADRPVVLFCIAFIVSLCLFAALSVVTLLWGLWVGGFGSFIVTALLSALVTALVGIPCLPLLKFFDPERGGYYLTRFMHEEREEPLV